MESQVFGAAELFTVKLEAAWWNLYAQLPCHSNTFLDKMLQFRALFEARVVIQGGVYLCLNLLKQSKKSGIKGHYITAVKQIRLTQLPQIINQSVWLGVAGQDNSFISPAGLERLTMFYLPEHWFYCLDNSTTQQMYLVGSLI